MQAGQTRTNNVLSADKSEILAFVDCTRVHEYRAMSTVQCIGIALIFRICHFYIQNSTVLYVTTSAQPLQVFLVQFA